MHYNIVIIGAGNVGHHLAHIFAESGNTVYIWSRTPKHAQETANSCRALILDTITDIPEETDFCIAALNEDAIDDVCLKLPQFRGILLHTAGSLSIDLLKPYSDRCGVLYPLQTFTKSRTPDYKAIPVFIEATNKADLHEIFMLATDNFQTVMQLNSEKRKFIHLAAIFACNFVNASLVATEEIAAVNQLDFQLFRPLIQETIDKTRNSLPSNNQTGPALRNNFQIIENHMQLLDVHHPHLKYMYSSITNYIKQYFHNE